MRKTIIYISVGVILAALIIFLIFNYNSSGNFRFKLDSSKTQSESIMLKDEDAKNGISKFSDDEKLTEFNTNIVITGLSQDGIPPIDDPKYISVSEADKLLEDWDKVFVYEAKENIFIYPQRILVWHEIVNENIDGEAISITYCPLTASTIGYAGNDGLHDNNTYGTSGNLLNSNLVLYDRESGSNIPQILGVGVDNSLEAVVLNTKPVHWASWSDAKLVYPNAKVLSTDTGFNRDYNKDPYGSYFPYEDRSYYQTGEPMFPLMNDNNGEFESKKTVVGVKFGSNQIAVDPLLVEKEKVLNFKIGSTDAVAFYDNTLKTVRVFDSSFEVTKLVFSYEDDKIYDQNNKVWNVNGISENDEKLDSLTYFDVLWFAWHAYYPDTEIIK